ncbi:50S ribosomal protein L11 methyltransferase [Pontixanthobacter gangjinensis]|uniref:Ribosomal protein L11 methyltransferase n=1 Tax=Pontixanthobacter gangjinensis TaxID=1028742 RepID=A0A6I4SLP2_9SPHN|nr:50S ribosomal protein L11 methyltransferase [Pontixanthobacter gangjinensis]MXO56811.1 methyltransferase [Pontixanthobacter gangjinensis]
MSDSWKITALATKSVVQDALLAHDEIDDWDFEIVVAGSEIAEDKPDDWQLEAWLPRNPSKADKVMITGLFEGKAPKLFTERVIEQDWLTLSQQGVEPIHAGKFYIHTPDHPPSADPALTNFSIPASQAFGTGQHETTAGCLSMLTLMKRTGVTIRNHADIGTGTGLLAFAAMDLWPRAQAIASDIDAVCTQVIEDNAEANNVTIGHRVGQLTIVIADGMDDPLLQVRGPYDLLIANILAGPLVELAPDFSASVSNGGHVVLAGLLTEQEGAVRRAYRKVGFRLAKRLVNGDWSILWLRKRSRS